MDAIIGFVLAIAILLVALKFIGFRTGKIKIPSWIKNLPNKNWGIPFLERNKWLKKVINLIPLLLAFCLIALYQIFVGAIKAVTKTK